MSTKLKTLMPFTLCLLLLMGFAWSANLTLFNYWASGGPPVEHPEIYRHRGNVFSAISGGFLLTFGIAAWALIRRLKRR
jgi:hypothetical protein